MKKIDQLNEEQFELMIRDQKKFKAYLKLDQDQKLNMDFWGTPELHQNLEDFCVYLGEDRSVIIAAKNPMGHKYAIKVECGAEFFKEHGSH